MYSRKHSISWIQRAKVVAMETSQRKIPVAILVRVSTVKQETARQISELQSYADAKGYEVVEICKETVSGRAEEDERHGLTHVEDLARSGAIRKVLVHEISRLARRNSVAHKFVETLEDYKVSLYWHAQGIETLLANGKRNPAAGIMLALLAEIARSEVETLRERINSGLAEARRKGVRLGRPPGTGIERQAFFRKHGDILRQLKAGHSVRHTAKITGKGVSTVQRVKLAVKDDAKRPAKSVARKRGSR
jgi:DNA invertase Pin-like site-specific DNA recombinase